MGSPVLLSPLSPGPVVPIGVPCSPYNIERDAQFALQSERLVQQRNTEAPKSTAPRPVKAKRPAAGKENRENFSTDPYARQFNKNKSRGISKSHSR